MYQPFQAVRRVGLRASARAMNEEDGAELSDIERAGIAADGRRLQAFLDSLQNSSARRSLMIVGCPHRAAGGGRRPHHQLRRAPTTTRSMLQPRACSERRRYSRRAWFDRAAVREPPDGKCFHDEAIFGTPPWRKLAASSPVPDIDGSQRIGDSLRGTRRTWPLHRMRRLGSTHADGAADEHWHPRVASSWVR